MTRISFFGFETGAFLSEWGTSSGAGTNISFDTSTVRTGTYALKVAAASGASGAISPQVAQGHRRRVYLRVTARPASTPRQVMGSGLRLRSDGKIEVYNSSLILHGTSTTALTDTTKWYRIEYDSLPAANGDPVLRIDGVDEVLQSGGATFFSLSFGTNDTVADTYTAYFDDYASDDTDWPGDGAVSLLVPISDSSRVDWTGGGGGTTNLWEAVNNIPPVGVADTGTDASQIRDATNGATDDYVANLTTYTNAGIGAGDTINAVQAFAVVAAPVTTSAKTGSLQTTNPAEAEVNFGSFYSGVNAGTFPTGWVRRGHTITQTPSVTLGNSPTLELGQRVSSTRIAMCCFMGIYVDYTPAVVTGNPPHTNIMPPLLAQ